VQHLIGHIRAQVFMQVLKVAAFHYLQPHFVNIAIVGKAGQQNIPQTP
jgi:hypothetical protein